ncbi:hypothetical protein SAMN05421803_1301, partial [Nocardiopsis flavescens]
GGGGVLSGGGSGRGLPRPTTWKGRKGPPAQPRLLTTLLGTPAPDVVTRTQAPSRTTTHRGRACAPPSPPRGRASRYPRLPPAADRMGATPSGWGRGLQSGGQPPGARPAGTRGLHPHGFAEPGTPSSTPWGRGGDSCSPAVPGAPRPCTFHPLRRWEGMGVLYVRAACRAHRPLQGAFLPPRAAELGSPRSTQPRMTPPPLTTCAQRTGLAVCRAPTAPGPGPRSAGRRFQAAELLENSGRAFTPWSGGRGPLTGWGRGLRLGGQPPVAGQGKCARPSPPCVWGGRYALPKPAGVGVWINADRLCPGPRDSARFTPYGVGRAWVGSTYGPLVARLVLCRGHSSRPKRLSWDRLA